MSVAHQLALREPLLHEQLELQARSRPRATAVRFGDETLDYGELNACANRLARLLRERGVGSGDRVVVCVEPSFDVVIALLALLKLGSVYVPLDPSYPEARVRAMLSDTQPRHVLTQRAVHERLSFGPSSVLELDRAGAELGAQVSENLDVFVQARQPAYVFYTSGTTGTPKGVVATHANLVSYIDSARRRYGFGPNDVGVALARYSFSISLFELLSPLAAGGSLLILERATILDFPRLAAALSQATFFHAGPSLLRGLLGYLERHAADFSGFPRMRHASSGGDMVPVDVVERLLGVFPNAEVFVIYGCSEISCMGTTWEVPRGAPLPRSYVGRAFAGTTVRVVDEELRDVATGVIGEVLFAGPGVVSGYLNRPELTAAKFVERGGLRFYRTGDRGRLDERGLLELLGRADFQVKIGGIRVELGEIEHHLRRAPGVANAVVSAKTFAGETALVAYLVVEEGDRRTSEERATAIRELLARHLPDYMLPALFVELPALPLNHNAKIDRRALPDPPAPAAPRRTAEALAARLETTAEQRLAAIWRELLGVPRVDRADNFFELGGTSLRALQLLAEIERQFGVTLTGLEILREPLMALAALCDRGASPERSRPAREATAPALEPFYFGPERSLYGVLHGAASAAAEAVLICAPLGHERLRAHFVLQQLARRLASNGIVCLRFDYYGCGDSLGEPQQATLSRFRRDICAAYRELRQRAGTEKISAVGARLGATLLTGAARELALQRVVLWDPVERGDLYRAELREAQRRYERGNPLATWRGLLERVTRRHPRELLGVQYSDATLQELGWLTLEPPAAGEHATLRAGSEWMDLSRLEDMLPDTGISARLSELLGYP